MGDEITHRSAHVASTALKLGMDGTTFDANRLQEYLERGGNMENVPSTGTIRKVLKQLREDGMLSSRHDGRTEASKELRAYRQGDFVPTDEIDADRLAHEVSDRISREAEQAVFNAVSEVERYYSHRNNRWVKKDELE